jgi:hypothetical protein
MALKRVFCVCLTCLFQREYLKFTRGEGGVQVVDLSRSRMIAGVNLNNTAHRSGESVSCRTWLIVLSRQRQREQEIPVRAIEFLRIPWNNANSNAQQDTVANEKPLKVYCYACTVQGSKSV